MPGYNQSGKIPAHVGENVRNSVAWIWPSEGLFPGRHCQASPRWRPTIAFRGRGGSWPPPSSLPFLECQASFLAWLASEGGFGQSAGEGSRKLGWCIHHLTCSEITAPRLELPECTSNSRSQSWKGNSDRRRATSRAGGPFPNGKGTATAGSVKCTRRRRVSAQGAFRHRRPLKRKDLVRRKFGVWVFEQWFVTRRLGHRIGRGHCLRKRLIDGHPGWSRSRDGSSCWPAGPMTCR